MNYISSKFRQRIKASLMEGNLVAAEFDEIKLSKFKTLQKKIDCIESAEFWVQEEHDDTKDDCHKFSSITRKDLSVACSVLHSIY